MYTKEKQVQQHEKETFFSIIATFQTTQSRNKNFTTFFLEKKNLHDRLLFRISKKNMHAYLTGFLVLVLVVLAYYMGWFSNVSVSAPLSTTPKGDANGSALLEDNKEKFTLESNPVSSLSGETTTAQVQKGAAITTSKPSDLLPKDANASWPGASGGTTANLADQIVPAELMDPSRQPVYTSTSKSKIPNWQLRADPLVDRSVTANQFWHLTPDVHPDMYKSRGVEITAVRPTGDGTA